MAELVVGIVIGGLISWFITDAYHRRSSTQVPIWAKPLIDSLPDSPVSSDRLIELYQQALETGDIDVDPMGSGYVVCPNFGAPASEFEGWQGNDARGDMYYGSKCSRCGHVLTSTEV